jgi:hypothetical protein
MQTPPQWANRVVIIQHGAIIGEWNGIARPSRKSSAGNEKWS